MHVRVTTRPKASHAFENKTNQQEEMRITVIGEPKSGTAFSICLQSILIPWRRSCMRHASHQYAKRLLDKSISTNLGQRFRPPKATPHSLVLECAGSVIRVLPTLGPNSPHSSSGLESPCLVKSSFSSWLFACHAAAHLTFPSRPSGDIELRTTPDCLRCSNQFGQNRCAHWLYVSKRVQRV
jgi:hypothetical protein